MAVDMRFAALAILGVYAVFSLVERVPALQFRRSRLLRPFFLTDVGWYLSAAAVALAFGPLLERLAEVTASLGIPTLAGSQLPYWVLLAMAVVLYDLGFFSFHVLLHRISWLWRVHKVHHSSRLLDWLATTRAHVGEHFFRNLPTQAFLFAIGMPAEAVASALVVYATFATLGHSNLDVNLRFLEPVFITPRLHRLHHVPETTEKNFGTIFSIWDRLAGSLVSHDIPPSQSLGVPGEEETFPQVWWDQLQEPFRARE